MTQFLAIAIYGLATIIFIVLGLIIIYHLRKYGFLGDATHFMIIVFVIVSLLLITASSVYVAKTDWSALDLSIQNSQTIQSDTPILGN